MNEKDNKEQKDLKLEQKDLQKVNGGEEEVIVLPTIPFINQDDKD